ncbi:MAG TPA: hypothetical protein VGS22_06150 [Thermoanaerobaculia bacterium]|jgi:hypothetical protein|nr:hypothetical protein [Thermoanaerobaculia bacterium]
MARISRFPLYSLLFFAAVPSLAQLTLTLDPLPTVNGLAAGARVAWICLSRVSVDSGIEIRRFSGVDQDTDGNGVIPLPFEGEVPPRSIWIAVVLESGAAVASTPGDFPDQPAELGLSLVAGRTPSEMTVALERTQGLLVRPGVAPAGSAWGFAATDGATGDAGDEADGAVLLANDGFTSIAEAPPLGAPQPGDVAVAIDVLTLSYQIQTLAAQVPIR